MYRLFFYILQMPYAFIALTNHGSYFRSMESQIAKQAHVERELRSQVEVVRDQLQAAHADANRKQVMVGNLSEVSDTPLLLTHMPRYRRFSNVPVNEVHHEFFLQAMFTCQMVPMVGVHDCLCMNVGGKSVVCDLGTFSCLSFEASGQAVRRD